jgi:hypothetical protein
MAEWAIIYLSFCQRPSRTGQRKVKSHDASRVCCLPALGPAFPIANRVGPCVPIRAI